MANKYLTLRVPECKGISLEQLGNKQLAALASLAGDNPAGLPRTELLSRHIDRMDSRAVAGWKVEASRHACHPAPVLRSGQLRAELPLS